MGAIKAYERSGAEAGAEAKSAFSTSVASAKVQNIIDEIHKQNFIRND